MLFGLFYSPASAYSSFSMPILSFMPIFPLIPSPSSSLSLSSYSSSSIPHFSRLSFLFLNPHFFRPL